MNGSVFKSIRLMSRVAIGCRAAPVPRREYCDPPYAEWTNRGDGRHVKGSVYEAYLERMRPYPPTEAYKKAMRKRQV